MEEIPVHVQDNGTGDSMCFFLFGNVFGLFTSVCLTNPSLHHALHSSATLPQIGGITGFLVNRIAQSPPASTNLVF
jgi:hypothetical protein